MITNSPSSLSPRLSIFITGRNDSFMHNFAYRLTTTLNGLAHNLEKIGRLDQVEVVISDWGSAVPLHQALTLSQAAQKITRYVIVPPALAAARQQDSEFPIVLAQNAVIRRCLGEYIMQTDSDVIFTVEFLAELFVVLEERWTNMGPVEALFFGAKRRQIPWEVVAEAPPLERLEEYIRAAGAQAPYDPDCGFGYCTTGMMMMHRRLWEDCRGYDERLIHWGWMEIDLGLRLTRKYPWFDLTMQRGMVLYHLEHYRDPDRKVARQPNPQIRNNAFRPNDENWGLLDCQLPEFRYGAASL